MNEDKKIKSSPKDFFLYLGSIVALYGASISLLNLLFDVINTAFPDVLNYNPDAFSSSIRLSIATLVIFFPVYIVIIRFLNSETKAHPEKRNLGVRKWLVYLTLFISFLVAATDLIVLINTFLSGEITLRFILKVVAVLAVAKLVFIYYFYDLRDKWKEKKNSLKIFTSIVSFLVLMSIVFAFVIVGSPKTQRLTRLDNQKVSDLQNIQWQIINYWQQKQALPVTLNDLVDPLSGFSIPKDPEGKIYSYEVAGKYSFKLCADFNLDASASSNVGRAISPTPVSVPLDNQTENWSHGIGKQCFDRTIDPQKYPPFSKQIK